MQILRSVAIGCALAVPAAADVIELRSDPWCPYVCVEDSRPGFMLEIATEALALYGHEVRFDVLPWSRAIHEARVGNIDGVISATPSEAPGLIFSDPMNSYVDAIAFRKGELVEVVTAEDLAGLRIGTIVDYEYYGAVDDYIAAYSGTLLVQFAMGGQPLETNLRKLMAGRIDAVAETDAVLRHQALRMGILDEIEIFTPEGSGFVHIAFAPGRTTSQTYVEQLNEGVARLRQSGRFDEIMRSYGQ